jgi:parallel beta-helix repeat protein
MQAKLRLHAAPATFASLALVLTLAVGGVVTLSSASTARSRGSRTRSAEAAKQPKCGDTIITDTTLHKDLVNCPNNGIMIGADNITLDLNGHTIDGDGTPAAGCDPNTEFCDFGVGLENHNEITVKHGSIRQFEVGVGAFGTRHIRLLGISASSNRFPGMVIGDSARSTVQDCSVFRNGLHTDQAGIVLFHSHHTRILNNSIRDNGDIALFMSRSDQNQIRDNRLRHHPEAGINVEGGDGNRISHNLLTADGDGIILGGDRNAIIRNRVVHSRAGPQSGGNGIHAAAGHHNLIASNVVARAATGIRVSLKRRELEGKPGAASTLIRGNRLRRAEDDGVLVMSTAKRTVLRRNRGVRSGDDGFDIDSRTKLTKNRALRNGDLGIEAVGGVIDGGGNVARHNGDSRQCTHIVCR